MSFHACRVYQPKILFIMPKILVWSNELTTLLKPAYCFNKKMKEDIPIIKGNHWARGGGGVEREREGYLSLYIQGSTLRWWKEAFKTFQHIATLARILQINSFHVIDLHLEKWFVSCRREILLIQRRNEETYVGCRKYYNYMR